MVGVGASINRFRCRLLSMLPSMSAQDSRLKPSQVLRDVGATQNFFKTAGVNELILTLASCFCQGCCHHFVHRRKFRSCPAYSVMMGIPWIRYGKSILSSQRSSYHGTVTILKKQLINWDRGCGSGVQGVGCGVWGVFFLCGAIFLFQRTSLSVFRSVTLIPATFPQLLKSL